MISSVMPSLKYSCLGSPLMLSKASTAMEGLSGSLSAGASANEGFSAGGTEWKRKYQIATDASQHDNNHSSYETGFSAMPLAWAFEIFL